ncbi:MAG: two-component system sensor histidine kinase NtrB [Thermodesulfobacteriota bacterium]
MEKLVKGKSWFFRPVTLLTIWILLALLVIFNGLYEAKRAKDNLYGLLFDEGSALISGLEKSIQSSFSSLHAIEAYPEISSFFTPPNFWSLDEAVVDLILEKAFRVDQELGTELPAKNKLREIAEKEHFSSLLIIFGQEEISPPHFCLPLLEGKSLYAIERKEKAETGQVESLSLAVARKAGKGVLLIHINQDDLRFYRRRVILQGVIEEWGGNVGIKYISFQGEDFLIWANTNPAQIGQKEADPFVKSLFQKGRGKLEVDNQRKPGIFEVAKVIEVEEGNRIALRIGLHTEKVEEIIAADRRNIFLFSLFLLVFGGLGITIIYRLENRHLAKLKELEDKIHQSEKLSSLANLAAAVAHEIRNPLNAISMAIQRLQREFLPAAGSEKEEYLRFTDVLRGEVQRVNEIIEQFLFFARPAKLQLSQVQITEILRDLVLLIQETAEQQKIKIEEEIAPHLPPLKVDRQRLQEALLNLANNALQAMPEGGNLKLAAKFSGDKEILIEVADSGPGIPPENLRRIFDYYFTTKDKGMGLGLPLAHKIIKEHGGRIEVISQVGRGTIFQVFLPPQEEG